jgi:hypothetical protein
MDYKSVLCGQISRVLVSNVLHLIKDLNDFPAFELFAFH